MNEIGLTHIWCLYTLWKTPYVSTSKVFNGTNKACLLIINLHNLDWIDDNATYKKWYMYNFFYFVLVTLKWNTSHKHIKRNKRDFKAISETSSYSFLLFTQNEINDAVTSN